MKLLTMLVISLMLCGIAYAEITVPETKVGIAYNIDDNRSLEAIGATVKEDLLGIKGVDYDILVASEIGETLTDDSKVFINQISYNYSIKENLGVFAGAGIGLERFEKFEDGRLGEHDKYITAGVSYKF